MLIQNKLPNQLKIEPLGNFGGPLTKPTLLKVALLAIRYLISLIQMERKILSTSCMAARVTMKMLTWCARQNSSMTMPWRLCQTNQLESSAAKINTK